ncbi:alpha/beta fold hydrolase [Utexia brackfieldae]|uniref:alpha/beta fold hydrolase n=1 Tax=Utexia brackfieldae TaxID=3074108 RepID=UPI00370D1C4A
MQLHYEIAGQGQPIILLHGLLGSFANLGVLARPLQTHYQTISVDLRNHGLSPWDDEMNYTLMAQDLAALIESLSLEHVTLIGHSMGGKVAMKLADIAPKSIKQLFVLDIAPITYQQNTHQDVFDALTEIVCQPNLERAQILTLLRQRLPEPVVQFLLKSYKQHHWLFNFAAIAQHSDNLFSWQKIMPCHKPICFIKGSLSDYITAAYQSAIIDQFPQAKLFTVDGAHHNVHAEKPQQVLDIINNLLC